jgi:hypothetical protein
MRGGTSICARMSRICICFAVMLSCCSLLPVQRVQGMHAEARAFLTYVRSNFSSYFHGEALDVVGPYLFTPVPSTITE